MSSGHGCVAWMLMMCVAPLVLVGSGSLPPTSTPKSGVYARQGYAPSGSMDGKPRGGGGWGPENSRHAQAPSGSGAPRPGDLTRTARFPDKIGHIGKVTKVQDVDGRKFAVVDREIYVPLSKADCWRPEGTELSEGDWVRLDAFSTKGKGNPWTCARFMKIPPPPGAVKEYSDVPAQHQHHNQQQNVESWDRGPAGGGSHGQWDQVPEEQTWPAQEEKPPMYQQHHKPQLRYGAPPSAPAQMAPNMQQAPRSTAYAQQGAYQSQYAAPANGGWPSGAENGFEGMRRDRPDSSQAPVPADTPYAGGGYAPTTQQGWVCRAVKKKTRMSSGQGSMLGLVMTWRLHGICNVCEC